MGYSSWQMEENEMSDFSNYSKASLENKNQTKMYK